MNNFQKEVFERIKENSKNSLLVDTANNFIKSQLILNILIIILH